MLLIYLLPSFDFQQNFWDKNESFGMTLLLHLCNIPDNFILSPVIYISVIMDITHRCSINPLVDITKTFKILIKYQAFLSFQHL